MNQEEKPVEFYKFDNEIALGKRYTLGTQIEFHISENFNKIQFIYLEILMLIPTINIPIILYYTKNSILTMLIYFFIFGLLFPYIYMKFLSKIESIFYFYFKKEVQINKIQLRNAIILSISIFFFFFSLTFGFISILNVKKLKKLMPFNINEKIEFWINLIFFSFLLPIFDNFFWRIFILKSLPQNYRYYGINCLHFGIMNFFNIFLFFNIWLSFLGFFVFFLLGCFYIYIKKLLRMISVILINFSINLGICFAFYFFVFDASIHIFNKKK